jgi:hypothetical protein
VALEVFFLSSEAEIAGQNPTSAKLDFHKESHSKDKG